MRKKFGRFLLVGVGNTAFTYIIYLICDQTFRYVVAYSIAFVSGIAISYALNAYPVLRSKGYL